MKKRFDTYAPIVASVINALVVALAQLGHGDIAGELRQWDVDGVFTAAFFLVTASVQLYGVGRKIAAEVSK